MVVPAGRYHLGPDSGRIILRTFRDGLIAQAGHDLTIEVTGWHGELAVDDTAAPARLEVRIDVGSLAVREGTGGVKALTDRDRREIAYTARRQLGVDRNPEAVFTATSFEPADGGGVIEGALTLAGTQRPVRLDVTETGPGRYRARTSVVQSTFGIKPYTAFLGALKLRDAVEVEVEIDVSGPQSAPA
jgi:polyisoprenoid-binding protein YceI